MDAKTNALDAVNVGETYGPIKGMSAVTPDDDDDIDEGKACRGLYVTGAGDVVVVFVDDSEATFAAAADSLVPLAAGGGWFPSWIKRVKATGTTATGIKALW